MLHNEYTNAIKKQKIVDKSIMYHSMNCQIVIMIV